MIKYCGARVLRAIRVPLTVELWPHLQACVAITTQVPISLRSRQDKNCCCRCTHLIAAAMLCQKVLDDVQDVTSLSAGFARSEAFQAAEEATNRLSGDPARRSQRDPSRLRVSVSGCRWRCCCCTRDQPSRVDRHARVARPPCWPRRLPHSPIRSSPLHRVSDVRTCCSIAAPSSVSSAD